MQLLPRRFGAAFGSIKLVVIDKGLRVPGPGGSLRIGGNAVHGTENHQLGVAFLRALAPEEVAQDWNVAQAGTLVPNIGNPVVNQARDDKTLSVHQLEFGLRFTSAQGRNGKTGDGERVREIEGADFGSNREVDIAVGHDYRGEIEFHAE